METLYNIAIRIYYLLIICVSPFHKKAGLWLKGRKKLFEKLSEQLNRENRYIWFHAASLGEFEQGRPVIEAFKKQHPEFSVLLSFFSPSGFELRKNYKGADIIIYLPMDFKRNVRRFMDIVNPELAIFIKYEFWYNYLNLLKKRNIPVFIISALFRSNQIFFKWYGKWFKNALSAYSCFFVQDRNSFDLLKSHGFSNVLISGDTRFDRVNQIAELSPDNEELKRFKAGKKIFIGGSTWEKDENILIEYINNSKNDIKYIIAPHEINKTGISRIISKIKLESVKYSDIKNNKSTETKVLIIDNLGMLSSLYKYGELAYIGGGFGVGIHNILEPASFGLPVLFGPNFQKFEEAKKLVELGGAFSINNFDQFKEKTDEYFNDQDSLNTTSAVCSTFVKGNCGATNIILERLTNFQC